MLKLPALPNLASAAVTGVDPTIVGSRPKTVDQRNVLTTKYCYYAGSFGENAARRLSKKNPPRLLLAIIGDYDQELDETEIESALATCDVRPTFIHKTRSGALRAIWQLDKPVAVASFNLAQKLLLVASKEIKIPDLFPSFDKQSLNPTQYYESAPESDWTQTNEEPLDSKRVTRWLMKAAKEESFAEEGPAIPLDKVWEAIQAKYPDHGWTDFNLDQVGRRFWDEAADNPAGCQVKPEGMVVYSTDEGFKPWKSLLGKEFVEQFKDQSIGKAVQETWFESRGSRYWFKESDNKWRNLSRAEIDLQMKVKYGLNPIGVKGLPSEIEETIYAIISQNHVNGIVSIPHKQEGFMVLEGQRVLNVTAVRPLEAFDGSPSYGEGFPWLASFLKGFVVNEAQENALFSWMHYFYRGAVTRNPMKGHALFLGGPAKLGKTFFSTGIISPLVGGSIDVSKFLLGGSGFSGTLYESPLWTLDDVRCATYGKEHDTYTALIKAAVANEKVTSERKYHDAVSSVWFGRPIITFNDDHQSARVLPNLDQSNEDKNLILRCADRGFTFPPRDQMDALLAAELPGFAAWLLRTFQPLTGDSRFGFPAIVDEKLAELGEEVNGANEFEELLFKFQDSWFKIHDKENLYEGSASDLFMNLKNSEVLAPLMYDVKTPQQLSRKLRQLLAKNKVGYRREHVNKIWQIQRNLEPFL